MAWCCARLLLLLLLLLRLFSGKKGEKGRRIDEERLKEGGANAEVRANARRVPVRNRVTERGSSGVREKDGQRENECEGREISCERERENPVAWRRAI